MDYRFCNGIMLGFITPEHAGVDRFCKDFIEI